MDLFIARQPVFDRNEDIFAYDLAALTPGRHGIHEEPTPDELISELFLEIGLDRVAPGHKVFLTLDRELLLSRRLPALPMDRVILEVPAALTGDPMILDACRLLRAAGYQIAAQAAHTRYSELDSLSACSDLVKVDVTGVDAEGLATIAEVVGSGGAQLLALNVRHRGQRDECLGLGFAFFQGLRFASPETYSTKVIAVQHLHAFQLLRLARDTAVSDEEIELFLRRDVGLAYRLLRMVNSAAIGGREISSIGHALRLLGREALSRWLCVLVATQVRDGGVQAELIHLALVRGRMCEHLADRLGRRAQRGSAFLVGMLSVFDQLLEVHVEALCESVGLATELRAALISRSGVLGQLLSLAESYADGAWLNASAVAAALRLDPHLLPALYLEALGWASGSCGPKRAVAS